MRRCAFVKLISGAVATWPVLLFAVPALWLFTDRLLAAEHDAIPVVVADFDYNDTSGEVADQRAEHAARVKAFAGLLRERLAGEGKYKVLRLDCAKATCSAGSIGADDLIAAARKADARLLVYGGIHKMSSLIEWGSVQVVALLLALDLDVFATLDLVLDVLVLATAFPLDLALALVVTLVMDLRLALAIRPSRPSEN